MLLFKKLEELVASIKPEDYAVPSTSKVPNTARLVGTATERIKILHTLYDRYADLSEANKGLALKDMIVAESLHFALFYEVGENFNIHGKPFILDKDWNIYELPIPEPVVVLIGGPMGTPKPSRDSKKFH